MTIAAYRVHRLIQDLMTCPAAAAEFARDAEPTFSAYGLEEAEKSLLRDGSPEALGELGVHPNLQMKYSRLQHAKAATGAGPLAAYLERLVGV